VGLRHTQADVSSHAGERGEVADGPHGRRAGGSDGMGCCQPFQESWVVFEPAREQEWCVRPFRERVFSLVEVTRQRTKARCSIEQVTVAKTIGGIDLPASLPAAVCEKTHRSTHDNEGWGAERSRRVGWHQKEDWAVGQTMVFSDRATCYPRDVFDGLSRWRWNCFFTECYACRCSSVRRLRATAMRWLISIC